MSRSPSPSVAHARAKVGALARSRTPDDPDLVAARVELKSENLERLIRQAVEAAPPLTELQRGRLARLLLAGAS